MNKLKVFSENGEEHQPVRSTKYAAAYDLRAARDFILKPCSLVHVPTGLYCEMPEDYCALILARSGLASKHGVMVSSSGLIDSDYRGEWMVPLYRLPVLKHSDQYIQENFIAPFEGDIMKHPPLTFKKGDRIAQALFLKYEAFEDIELLKEWTIKLKGDRKGGFGSTGLK